MQRCTVHATRAAPGAMQNLASRRGPPSPHRVQRITGATKVIFLACVASIAVLSVLKDIFRSRTFHPFVLNLGYHVASAGMAFAILAVLLFFWGSSLYRLSVWRREGWALSKRRRMSLTNAYLQAGLTAAILLSWAVNNAHRAADASLFCEGHPALAVYPLIQWTAWNCLLCVILIDAHSLVMRPTAEWPDRQVRDLPWYVHWPKAILWCVAQGAPPRSLHVAHPSQRVRSDGALDLMLQHGAPSAETHTDPLAPCDRAARTRRHHHLGHRLRVRGGDARGGEAGRVV